MMRPPPPPMASTAPARRAVNVNNAIVAGKRSGGMVQHPHLALSRSAGEGISITTSSALVDVRHHRFAELAAALGRGFDGVDEGRAESALLERVEAGDGGAARRGHHV